MVAQRLPAVEAASPGWFLRWAGRLPDFYAQRFPVDPVKLPVVATTADLPDPAKFNGCILFHNALGQPCVSNGAHWFPITLGAHL